MRFFFLLWVLFFVRVMRRIAKLIMTLLGHESGLPGHKNQVKNEYLRKRLVVAHSAYFCETYVAFAVVADELGYIVIWLHTSW